MIEVLQLGRASGYARLTQAIEQALVLGTHDTAAVRYLLGLAEWAQAPSHPLEVPVARPGETTAMAALVAHHYVRPLPQMQDYDLLLQEFRGPLRAVAPTELEVSA